MSEPVLILAAAADRLRGKPGRPRKDRPAAPATTLPAQAARLLDLPSAAAYLACSTWTLRDLVAAGTLRRVRVPLPGGSELRKVLLDRADLDRLIEAWKAGGDG